MLAGKKSEVKNLFYNVYESIFCYGFSLILGQGLFVGLFVFMLTPMVNYVFRLALAISGFSYITSNNIGKFLFYPFTLIMMLILFTILGLFFLFEGVYLITYFSMIKTNKKPKIVSTLVMAFQNVINLIKGKKFMLLPYTFIVTLTFNVPLIAFIIKKIRLLRIAIDMINKNDIKKYTLIIFIVIIILLVFRNIYGYSFSIVKNSKLKETKEYHKNIDNIEKLKTVIYFLIWNIGLAILAYIIYLLTTAIAALIAIGVTDKELVIVTILTIYERMSLYIGVILFLVNIIGNYSLLCNLIHKYGIIDIKTDKHYVEEISLTNEKGIQVPIVSKIVSYKKLIIVLVVTLICSNALFMYDIIRNGSLLNFVSLDTTKVTSHRGFSKNTPENTIPALEKAIEEKADFIEVDVRQTADGELVLLHDESLKRTTGVNKKIWEVDSLYLSTLDAGKWLSSTFEGVRVPTLREVFELCKGKININLDLKYNKKYPNFEENVVALIEEYDMELQCVISSTKLSVLNRVKEINSNIKTGYIIYQISEAYYDNSNIDFFSMNSYFISERVLQQAHSYGKEIHAWTVNSKNELERMNRLGVDNIITDNPAFAKVVLFEADSDPLLVTVLKMMIKY
jgi:glycerophosphoryl diester phosphodiesterase